MSYLKKIVKRSQKLTVSNQYIDRDNIFSYKNLQFSYQMCNSCTCRGSVIYISARDLSPPYPAIVAALSGLPSLRVSLILCVWGLNYSPSSVHLLPIFQWHVQFVTWFVCFLFNSSSKQLVYFIIPTWICNIPVHTHPILWGFHPAKGCPLLCNFLELFSDDIFHPENLLFPGVA